MTLLQRYLAFYVEVCQRSQTEKENAWQCAKESAIRSPEALGELPELLKAEMLRRKSQGQLIGSGGKSE